MKTIKAIKTQKELIAAGCVIFQHAGGAYVCVGPVGSEWTVRAISMVTLRRRATEKLNQSKN